MTTSPVAHARARLGRIFTAFLCLLVPSLPLVAQGWQRVVNLADKPGSAIGGGSANTLFAGLTSGHVFRSVDNGITWKVITNGLVDKAGAMLLPKAFLVTPSGRVLRGGDNASWNGKAGSPIFYSDNQGDLWKELPLPFGSATRNPAGIGISDLVLHQGALYFSDLLSEGVWKSVDDSASWVAAGEQLPTPPFIGTAKTYYAVASAGNALLTVQASKGVFRSTDGGATWSQAVNGIPGVVDSPLVGGRSWSGSDVVGLPDGTAFAASDNRLYRSRDGGASWVEVGQGILQSPNPFAPTIIGPSVRKVEVLGGKVYVSSSDGNPRFFEGSALGDSWTELPAIPDNTGNASLLAQSFYAHNGALYFAGSKGIYRLDLATVVRTNILPIVSVPAGPFGVNVGSALRLTATVGGTAPFNYEWRLGGNAIAGQTAATLDFTPASTNQTGVISLVVSNAAGRVTNVLGQLSVAPVGPGFIDYGFPLVNTVNSLLDIIPLPVTLNTFAFGADGSVVFGGSLYSSKEGYTALRRVFADGTPDRAFATSASAPGASAGAITTLLPLADGTVLVGASGTGNDERYYRRMLKNGSLDAAYPWPAEVAGGPRKMVRLADGRFLTAGGSVGGIRRLNADGTFDASFQGPGTIGRFQANYVTDFALLPDGRIVIVGNFNEIDGATRVGVARLLPNGVLDRGWVPAQFPANNTVINALALLPDGHILVGGTFATVGGQSHRNLARLNADGTLDTSVADLIPNAAGTVNAFAVQRDGKAWVGGAFKGVAGRDYLFRLNVDGTVDSSFRDIAINGSIAALRLTDDGRLWIGGAATLIGGFTAGTPARIFTDINGPTVGFAGLDQTPDADSSITLRGTVQGPYTGLQWRFQGAPIPGATGLELPLNAVTVGNSGSYDLVVNSAGGSYTSAPVNVRVRGAVVLDQPPLPAVGILSNSVSFSVSAFGKLPLSYQWLRNGAPIGGATDRILTLTNLLLNAAADYSVKVTGGDGASVTSEPAFLTVIPAPGSKMAAFQPALFPSTTFTVFKDIDFLPDGRVLVAGNFSTTTAGGPNAYLARLNADGSRDAAFSFNTAGISELVAIERQGDGRIVVLVRSTAGGGPYLVRRLLENGSPDTSFAESTVVFGSGINLTPDGGVLVLGSQGLIKLKADGSTDTAFGQKATMNAGPISASVDPSGRIYITGTFTTVGGSPRPQFARLLPDGTLDAGFAPSKVFSSQWFVTALVDGALVSDFNGFYRFNNAGGLDSNYGWATRLGAWDLTGSGGVVGALATSTGDGVILDADGFGARPVSQMKVPGSFSGYSFLRVAPDGAFWLALGGNGSPVDPSTMIFRLNGTVTPLAIVTQPKSQIALAGSTVTLTGGATGTSQVHYQWRRNGSDLPGETNATLTLSGFSAAQEGDYTFVASNRSGSITSQTATVALLSTPVITAEPVSVVASAGQATQFAVTAKGLQLRFQWRNGITDLPNETNAVLSFSSVNAASAGVYSVRITNPAGSVISREARLRVRPVAGGGGGSPEGLVTRLRFEKNYTDEVAGLVTTALGSPTFVSGTEGDSAVSLRGGSNWLQMGDPNAGAAGRLADEKFTLSFWIKPETGGSINVYSFILMTPNANPATFTAREHLLYLGGNDNLAGANRINLYTRTFNSVISTDSRAYVPNLVGKWTHFAVVYRGTSPANPDNFSVYVNGESLPLKQDALISGAVSLVNALGRYAPSAIFQLDDFRVYNRALGSNEVAALRSPPVSEPAPVITGQPAGGSAAIGGAFTFNVAATGDHLFYEWYRGNTLLPDADGSSLVLSNISASDAGNYRVVISNGGGSKESAVASLAVNTTADPFNDWAAAAGLTGANAAPEADADRDGADNLSEFYYGTSPADASSRPAFEVRTETVGTTAYPAIAIVRRQAVGGIAFEASVSSSVLFADDLGAVVVSTTPLAGGLERVVIRSNTAQSARSAQFFRFILRR